ncbi:MAG TPA: metal ABC transporter permease [Solirubrobacteraceae bacterium]|jgi:zinc/manganese transport system permease protein
MFEAEFMRNALLAGTFIALACGLSGYFLVLRGQVFAGDALSHVAFPGALAAAAAGLDERVGLFAVTVLFGALIGALGRRSRARDTTIGIVFTFVLGLGVFFAALLASGAGGGSGIQVAHTLFGSIFGLGHGEALLAGAIALAVVGFTALIARPLLFASIDPAAALARGVPVDMLNIGFLVALGVIAAEATQALGALLLLGLLAAPAGAAHRLTSSPLAGMLLAGALSLLAMWAGLCASYEIPALPPSSAIVLIAASIYLLAGVVAGARRRAARRGAVALAPATLADKIGA